CFLQLLPPDISPLSLHDALPISSHSATSTRRVASSLVAVAALNPMVRCSQSPNCVIARSRYEGLPFSSNHDHLRPPPRPVGGHGDRKSTRLNSSHVAISYAVFCL